eukprot:jgi/Psemu1/310366/fgenesh1_kg.629_\
MKRYSTVSDGSETSSRMKDSDSVSLASSHRRFSAKKRINSELSEPLTAAGDDSFGEASGDPYFVFRSDLQNKLELVDEFLADFLRVVHETNTAVNSHEYKDSKKQLKRQIKSAESTLRDVQATVQAVEKDRGKFPHIDDSGLFDRRSLVETSRSRIQHTKDEMNSESVKKKLLGDERQKAVKRSGDGLLGAKNDVERQNTNFIMNNQAQSSMLIQEQDETLDELGEAVTRVGEMAGHIGEEIGQQNKMLDELDQDMTNVEEELGLVMGKMAKFMGTKDRWQLRTILILTLIMIVMLFLVIYS